MSDNEIETGLREIILELGANSIKDMGKSYENC